MQEQKNKLIQFPLRVSIKMYDRLKERAKFEERSMAKETIIALRKHLRKQVPVVTEKPGYPERFAKRNELKGMKVIMLRIESELLEKLHNRAHYERRSYNLEGRIALQKHLRKETKEQ